MLTNKMHTFQINVLVHFVSSTCFENHVFIIRKTMCTCSFVWYVFLHLYKQSSNWKNVRDTLLLYLEILVLALNGNRVETLAAVTV
jgi:hypothetical protein